MDELTKSTSERLDVSIRDTVRSPLQDVSSNTPRAVKRLRLKSGVMGREESPGSAPKHYYTTMRDEGTETPRRMFPIY